jgi:hypothetical protein
MTDDTGAQAQTIANLGIAKKVAVEPGVAVTPPKKPAARQMPKWEAEARDRVRAAVRRFAKPLADLIARDANEGDTRLLVTDFLCEALGYDKYEDLTTEYQVRGEFDAESKIGRSAGRRQHPAERQRSRVLRWGRGWWLRDHVRRRRGGSLSCRTGVRVRR